MDDEYQRRREVGHHFMELAEASAEQGDRKTACYHYINCLHVFPEFKPTLKQGLLFELAVLAEDEDEKPDEDVFVFYEEATQIYDDCADFFHDFGTLLLRLGHANRAVFYLREALERDNDCLPANRNLNSACCALFERWHYRMLNDEERNEAFRQAITKKVMRGHTSVLDIGTGTGLFCWYARSAGADKVYGCDYNNTMIGIAKNVQKHLGPNAADVKLISKHSDELSVPFDIPERVSLVVTETIDAGLLGEHLLQTVSYAWQNLLLPPPSSGLGPSGAVIPKNGSVWFTLVQSDELARKYMYPLSGFDPDSCAHGLANISLSNTPSSSSPENLSFMNLCVDSDEPYDSERVQTLPDLKYLAEPQRLLHVDFNDPADVEKHLRNTNRTRFDVQCSSVGEFHAVVAWFHVQVDEDIELSSRPEGANGNTCCWEQAVFPCTRAQRLTLGSVVTLSSGYFDGKIDFRVESVERCPPVAVPSSFVRMLNDPYLMRQLQCAAEQFINEKVTDKEINILDTFPVPVFGLLVLRRLRCLCPSMEPQLYCVLESESAKEAILKIAQHNGIPLNLLRWIKMEELLWRIPNHSLDAIVLDVLDQNGDLKESVVNRMEHLVGALRPGGVMLPNRIDVCGQMVNSEYIERNARVGSSTMEQMGIAEAINEYQVSQMLEMNLSALSCTIRSMPFTCHKFTLAEFAQEQWKEFFVLVRESGPANAIVYWYNMYFLDVGHEVGGYTTFNRFSYVHQAAFVLKSPIVLSKGERTVITFLYHNGILMIKPSNECE